MQAVPCRRDPLASSLIAGTTHEKTPITAPLLRLRRGYARMRTSMWLDLRALPFLRIGCVDRRWLAHSARSGTRRSGSAAGTLDTRTRGRGYALSEGPSKPWGTNQLRHRDLRSGGSSSRSRRACPRRWR